jgi:hypothetical protein
MNGFKDKQFIEKKVGEINKIQDSGHKAQEKLLKILALPTINNKEYMLTPCSCTLSPFPCAI